MAIDFQQLYKTATVLTVIACLSACGGDDAFAPNYDENATPPDRRVDGEMPFSSPSLMKMADSFRIAGDYTNAIRLYQRAANESPRHVTSRVALGQIYQRLGAVDGAITYYKQVLELEPDNEDAVLGLGQVMVRTQSPLEAVEYLERAAEKSPNNYRIYNSIGLAYDLEGLHDQAQQAYGRGLNKKPDHISLLNNLALSLAFQDEFAPSIQLLSKAVNLDYSQTTAQQNLIMVYALSGEEEAARTMANSFNTPDEIDGNMARYRWIRGLSSKRRAQAVFLNLNSFPEEEEQQVVQVPTDSTKTQPLEKMDPKKQMLADILNSEPQKPIASTPSVPAQEVALPKVETEVKVQPVTEQHDPEEMMPQQISVPAGNRYHLQLGSYLSENDGNMDWKRLNILAPELLKDQSYELKSVMTAGDQQRFRLFIGNYDNFSAAQENCQLLENQQVPCLVLNMPTE